MSNRNVPCTDRSGHVRWDAAMEAWLGQQSISRNTRRAYAIAAGQFFDWAEVEPWQVTTALATAWVRWMAEERGLAPATVGQRLAALSSFYNFAGRYTFRTATGQEESLWPADKANPFAAVTRPRVSLYGRATFPSLVELQAILGAINTKSRVGKRDFALLYTLVTTCRRSSEVLNMQWGDLQEMEGGDVSFEYINKGGDRRRGVLNWRTYRAICDYLEADGRPPEEMEAGDYIFVPLYPRRAARLPQVDEADLDPGRALSNTQANRILKKYGRRVGMDEEKAHLHGLRHAGARLRVQQAKDSGRGVDYMELMQLLGHSSLAVTQIYSQTVLEDPEDPGGDTAALALLPKGKRRGQIANGR